MKRRRAMEPDSFKIDFTFSQYLHTTRAYRILYVAYVSIETRSFEREPYCRRRPK